MTEPLQVVAGSTATWTVPAGDYAAPTWTLSYALLKPGCDRIEITATDNGDGSHLVTVAASDTAGWESGEYYWQRNVTNGSVRHTTGSGRLEIKPNFAAANVDPRSSAKKTLDALEAVREGKATGDQLSMSLNGRSISRMSWDEVNSAWNHFKNLVDQEVALEKDELGTSDQSNTVKAAFSNA